jgi:hypothetical protein
MAIYQASIPPSSPPMSELPRPAMRRKSSAQNLLSSFRAPTAASAGSVAGGSMSAATGAAFAAAVQTPTTSVPSAREWDGQSVHSDTLSSTATLVTNGTPVIAQGTSVEYLRDLVQKRIITLTYMRNVHEGCVVSLDMWLWLTGDLSRSHWFHTIMMSRNELDKVFNNLDMRKRCARSARIIIGCSAVRKLGHIASPFSRCRYPTYLISPKHTITSVVYSTR